VYPEVLLFDEPTSALDPLSTAKIEELIVELKRKSKIGSKTVPSPSREDNSKGYV